MHFQRNLNFWPTYFFLLPLFFVLGCSEKTEPLTKPNIILVLADDQGWGDLAINGNPYIQTPNIDLLAKEGAQFSRFYVSPVCSPTRAEILTGRFHPRGGIYDTSAGGERLDLDETTLSKILQENGYATAVFGKWHNGSQPPYHPNNRGFDEFYGFASGHWGNYMSPMLEHNGEVVKGKGFIIDDLTDHSLQYIQEHQTDPFFILLAYNTPHSPMQVPDFWWDKYKDIAIDSTHRNGDKEHPDKTRAALALSENIDWNVGRIVSELDSLKMLENTIIIYMSDNGPNGWRWNEGLKGIKGSTDEGGVRSPFIVNWKDKILSKTIDQIASTIDILPTLLDLVGIQKTPEKPIDGKSLKPLLLGESEVWEDRFVFSHWNGNVSVRNQQFMLDQNDQLYDLILDPGQERPLENPADSIYSALLGEKRNWENSVLKELDRDREEVFPVGFPAAKITQLPARDGIAHGTIQRSNRFPNSSFFTNWTQESDSITWNSDVLASGDFKATIYYTAKPASVGSTFYLKQGNKRLESKIEEAYDPPFIGVEFDRFPRQESYEKEFKALEMGIIHLDKGRSTISLHGSEIKGPELMDFRLLVLERIK